MTALIIIICFILVTIVLVQIGKVTELTAQIKGERETLRDNSKWNGLMALIFLVVFLVGVCYSAWVYSPSMLGYGPHESASAHGGALDDLFHITLIFTGIVFILTHIALFWFSYHYRYKEDRKAKFIAHDNRLEIWWTVIPAVVMTVLVVRGLNAWNMVMGDVKEGENFMEIEATGQQFNWIIRYPGPDGKLGARNYKLTTGTNQLGQDFTDRKNYDDLIIGQEFYLPVGKKVRVRIMAKDVLHNFDLPHFRVKMDAVPGLPTYFIFTPIKTTAQYREELRKYPEYNEPFDPADPSGPKRWEKFDYELACAELCGKGHYSMRRVLKVVSQEEYDAWVGKQESFYLTQMRGKEGDPNMGVSTLPFEAGMRAKQFEEGVKKAVESTNEADKTLLLSNVQFENGAATLTQDSEYELNSLVKGMTTYPQMNIRVAVYGGNAAEQALAARRAAVVAKYLTDRGIAANRLQAQGLGATDGKNRIELTITNAVSTAQ